MSTTNPLRPALASVPSFGAAGTGAAAAFADTGAAGAAGEANTANLIAGMRLPAGTIAFHDLTPKGWNGNIDHALIKGNMLVAVDTKRWRPGTYETRTVATSRDVWNNAAGRWEHETSHIRECFRDGQRFEPGDAASTTLMTDALVKETGWRGKTLTIVVVDCVDPARLDLSQFQPDPARIFVTTPAQLETVLRQALAHSDTDRFPVSPSEIAAFRELTAWPDVIVDPVGMPAWPDADPPAPIRAEAGELPDRWHVAYAFAQVAAFLGVFVLIAALLLNRGLFEDMFPHGILHNLLPWARRKSSWTPFVLAALSATPFWLALGYRSLHSDEEHKKPVDPWAAWRRTLGGSVARRYWAAPWGGWPAASAFFTLYAASSLGQGHMIRFAGCAVALVGLAAVQAYVGMSWEGKPQAADEWAEFCAAQRRRPLAVAAHAVTCSKGAWEWSLRQVEQNTEFAEFCAAAIRQTHRGN